ncbi:MAG: D-amino acid aminotransferase [Gammaproteobacteria bacterium RBG_16_51_14]|nr:MAG: D-amino acid aminotransferase [Gammaproteobacteria bacterium RBG_16_51_14]
MATVFLNGEYIPLEKAFIHVMDRGFIFADGVYEVIPVFNQHIFRLEEHLQRLNNSLDAVYMTNPYDNRAWSNILYTLTKQGNVPNQSLYIQVTRGISERDHDIDTGNRPTVFVMCNPIKNKGYDRGISAITHDDIRWQYCHIKAINLLPSVLLRHRAKEKGARETILIRGDQVTEGAASNVFIVQGSTVKTPPKDGSVLPGITRDLLVELLNNADMKCEESIITLSELRTADEIWITSSTWEVVPVIELDSRQVGGGVPGKMWNRANRIYQEFKSRLSN